MPERMPNSLASYEAVDTTPRSVGSPRPPTTTGLPASSGCRNTSTAARNSSRSTCSTQARGMPPSCRLLSVRCRLPHGENPDGSGLLVLDLAVGAREDHALVTVWIPDQVRRLAAFA